MIININLRGNLADSYGRLKAAMAELNDVERRLKARILEDVEARGVRAIEGREYRVAVSQVTPGMSFNAAKARAMLSESAIEQCMVPRPGTVQYRVSALQGEEQAA